jgi:hypothetical protein
MFVRSDSLESTRIVLICEERSTLFVKEASVNTSSFRVFLSSSTNLRPLVGLSICYCKRLFSNSISVAVGLVT